MNLNLKTKKIIARETLILFSIGGIIIVAYLVLLSLNHYRKTNFWEFTNHRKELIEKKDSIISLPWNLPWLDDSTSQIQSRKRIKLSEASRVSRKKKLPIPSPSEVNAFKKVNSDWIPPEAAVPTPDLEYALKNSKHNKNELFSLVSQIEEYDSQILNSKSLDIEEILLTLTFILIGLIYILRPLWYVISWSIKTLKR